MTAVTGVLGLRPLGYHWGYPLFMHRLIQIACQLGLDPCAIPDPRARIVSISHSLGSTPAQSVIPGTIRAPSPIPSLSLRLTLLSHSLLGLSLLSLSVASASAPGSASEGRPGFLRFLLPKARIFNEIPDFEKYFGIFLLI